MGDGTVDRINAVLFPLLSSQWTDEEAKDFHEYISVGENDVASLHAFLLCQKYKVSIPQEIRVPLYNVISGCGLEGTPEYEKLRKN